VNAVAQLPPALHAATADQPGARAALAAALAAPTHAFLFTGPSGTGKRAAARAFAAELLADEAPDPGEARRRALAEPSPHPDLAWLEPPGNQHLVDQVRERVIAAAAFRPFEGERRVFVIAAAEAMADESQNALLKTLEEPAPFAHLILITSEPEALLETVRSRCQPVPFVGLSPEVAEARLAERVPQAGDDERRAAARLAGGDLRRAERLLSESGRELRQRSEACVAAALAGELDAAPWAELLAAAHREGELAGSRARELVAEAAERQGAPPRRAAREAEEAGRRASRRARTDALDLGLALICARLRDLAAVGEEAPDLVLGSDRLDELREAAEGVDPLRARRAAELAMDTRRRLRVNVNEELALEALLFRVESLLNG
jgi:DNA polymerase-3 subunit delta'